MNYKGVVMQIIKRLINVASVRMDRARYALACDDEANIYYGLTACTVFRIKLVVKAVFLHK